MGSGAGGGACGGPAPAGPHWRHSDGGRGQGPEPGGPESGSLGGRSKWDHLLRSSEVSAACQAPIPPAPPPPCPLTPGTQKKKST